MNKESQKNRKKTLRENKEKVLRAYYRKGGEIVLEHIEFDINTMFKFPTSPDKPQKVVDVEMIGGKLKKARTNIGPITNSNVSKDTK